jgi:hypothetical protein
MATRAHWFCLLIISLIFLATGISLPTSAGGAAVWIATQGNDANRCMNTAAPLPPQSASPKIGISGDKFTINGTPTFLLGASYFDAYGWNISDLDCLAARKFNLIFAGNMGFFFCLEEPDLLQCGRQYEKYRNPS